MPRQILVLLSVLVLTAGYSFGADAVKAADTTAAVSAGQPSEAPQTPGNESSHTVVKGDTLWGLAGKYYGDPWAWTKLWQVNRNMINDPNLIYTNQVLVIPDKSRLKDIVLDLGAAPSAAPENKTEETMAAVAGGEAAAEEPAAAPPVEAQIAAVTEPQEPAEAQVVQETAAAESAELPGFDASKKETPAAAPFNGAVKKYMGSASMVVPKNWAVDGKIVGERDKKLMISAGDTVYVNLGKDRVKSGTLCMIYRKIGKIKIPKNGSSTQGYEVRRVGKLEITDETGSDVSSARIIVSYEPISTGDSIKIIHQEN